MTRKKATEQTLEASLKRLEEIVETLEDGELSLEKSIELYEEGLEVSKICNEKLKATELRLKKLSQRADGQFELEDLDSEESS